MNFEPSVLHRTTSPSVKFVRMILNERRWTFTLSNLHTGYTFASHQIPHAQRPIPAYTKRNLSGWVDAETVDTTFVPLERAQDDPVSGVE